jgi:hypothetical protein
MARFKGSSRFLARYRCEGPRTWIASNGSADLTRQFLHMAFSAAPALVNDFYKPRTSAGSLRDGMVRAAKPADPAAFPERLHGIVRHRAFRVARGASIADR